MKVLLLLVLVLALVCLVAATRDKVESSKEARDAFFPIYRHIASPDPLHGLPGHREFFGSAVYNVRDAPRILYYAGADYDPSNYNSYSFYADMWQYIPASNSWTMRIPSDGSPIPSARMGPAFALHEHTAYMFGGLDASMTLLNDLWSYDLRNDTWTVLSPSRLTATAVPPASSGSEMKLDIVQGSVAAVIVLGGNVFPPGSSNQNEKTCFYSLVTGTWYDASPRPSSVPTGNKEPSLPLSDSQRTVIPPKATIGTDLAPTKDTWLNTVCSGCLNYGSACPLQSAHIRPFGPGWVNFTILIGYDLSSLSAVNSATLNFRVGCDVNNQCFFGNYHGTCNYNNHTAYTTSYSTWSENTVTASTCNPACPNQAPGPIALAGNGQVQSGLLSIPVTSAVQAAFNTVAQTVAFLVYEVDTVTTSYFTIVGSRESTSSLRPWLHVE